MRRVQTGYLKWILPILYIGYYWCVSFYAHVHIEDGQVILHSHPFSHAQNSTPHQHASLEEIIFFHNLSSINAIDGAVQAFRIEGQMPSSYLNPFSKSSSNLPRLITGRATPRAPPIA